MRRIIGDFHTVVEMEPSEATNICKLGQGEGCCAFLTAGNKFECWRMNYPDNGVICNRLSNGSMNAKGRGGWENCAWEGQEYREGG